MPHAPVSSSALPPTDVPGNFMQMMQMAELLAEAGTFLPEKLRKKPHNILAVMFHARSLNIPLAVAWKELYLARDGEIGRSARLERALARRAGHRIDYVEVDRFHATCLIYIKGEPKPHEVSFTWNEAQAMGLTEVSERTGKGGEQYHKQPENMLVARVTTRAINRYCPEVTLGMPAGFDDMDEEWVMPDETVVSAAREERRERVEEVLHLVDLAERTQRDGATRLLMLRELFIATRDATLLDIQADDTGERSVRQVLTEKLKAANWLAQEQAAGRQEPFAAGDGPMTLLDLRGLWEEMNRPEGEPTEAEAPAEEAPQEKPKRKARKKAPAKAKGDADQAPAGKASKKVPAPRKEPDANTDSSPAGRAADRPGGRAGDLPHTLKPDPVQEKRKLPCGCIVDDVLINDKHDADCFESRS